MSLNIRLYQTDFVDFKDGVFVKFSDGQILITADTVEISEEFCNPVRCTDLEEKYQTELIANISMFSKQAVP
ncbi:hypothetical protein [Flavobacterium psychrophilum]|uniref:hypothetical protein n=1 Tax=Flavobacterium psychrophilum TaxID=96345 RepID=UPI001D05EDA3|nr:hypothetical protein [Flavobacterium psychrophilum]MCB6099649.1 hypothetical protein [Flavobacterium psychrophilum]